VGVFSSLLKSRSRPFFTAGLGLGVDPPLRAGSTGPKRRQDMAHLGLRNMSGDRTEFDIYRRWRLNKRAEFQFAVRVLNSKDGDRVGVLVRGVKECPRGIDVHSARPLPSRRFPADDVELPRGRVDREHRDAVVTAVRVVEKSSALVDADSRRP